MGETKYHQGFKIRDCLMVFISKATTSNMCLSNPSIPPPPTDAESGGEQVLICQNISGIFYTTSIMEE